MKAKLESVVELQGSSYISRLIPAFGRGFHDKDYAKMNRKSNAYLRYQFRRLERVKDEDVSFVISMSLIRRSRAFRTYMFNKVFRGGFYHLDKLEVRKIFKELDKISYHILSEIRYKRVYIPKSGGRWRPLGVPSPAGRLYGSMGAFLMGLTFPRDELKYQHAFQRGKGCGSAGGEIIERYRTTGEKPVYEYDFKGFFDNISHRLINSGVLKYGSYLHGRVLKPLLNSRPIPFEMKKGDPETKFEGRKKRPKYLDTFIHHNQQKVGTPQGFPLSPLGAIIGANEVVPKENHIMYADDGVLYEPEGPESRFIVKGHIYGLHLNELKSRKIEGELTFLGLRWNYEGGTLCCLSTTEVYEIDTITKETLRRIMSDYEEGSKEWKWEINENSYLKKDKRNVVWTSLTFGSEILTKFLKNTRRYKFWDQIVVDYLSASTVYCSDLMVDLSSGKSPYKSYSISKILG